MGSNHMRKYVRVGLVCGMHFVCGVGAFLVGLNVCIWLANHQAAASVFWLAVVATMRSRSWAMR